MQIKAHHYLTARSLLLMLAVVGAGPIVRFTARLLHQLSGVSFIRAVTRHEYSVHH